MGTKELVSDFDKEWAQTHHRDICVICANKTVARLFLKENKKRMDLCYSHATATAMLYPDDIIVMAAWGGFEVDDFLMENTNEN